ncbi:MAG: amidoligase family protein [Ectothiorhodospiraceae bacterium]|nr:amidoligase family protein [Chromatiales bacterium]MCP5155516.1 amidoligase family protein [Ectothiorhodospiraceae bacterium]
MSEHDHLPRRLHTADGAERRVGVEFELSGIELDDLAALVRASFGGTITQPGRYEREVEGTAHGTYRIEVDFELLKSLGRTASSGRPPLERLSEEVLQRVAEPLVPLEVVSPPIALRALPELDRLVRRLRDAGGRGTRSSPLFAFGLHLNPELPALDAPTITAYLKAFLVLHDWLAQAGDVDWSRRLTPYIRPYPPDLVARLVDPDYWPPLDRLMDDVLAAAPDRNRALDMLPLFAHLDPERVAVAVDDPRVNARPTLHYRLPNCEVDEPHWGVLVPWLHWLEVERLADARERLDDWGRAYREHLESSLLPLAGSWARWCAARLPGGAVEP